MAETTETPRPEKIFPVSWDQFHRDSRALAWRLHEVGPFEAIVCITRGGLVPAAIVARELNVRMIETVCVVSYRDYRNQGELSVLKSISPEVTGLEKSGKGILIVDDHAILRRGLSLMIAREPDLELAGEAGTIAEALEAAARTAPDVVILDIHLPDGSGISAIAPLRALRPAPGIVVLSMYDDFEHVRRAFAEGAGAYVVKSVMQPAQTAMAR